MKKLLLFLIYIVSLSITSSAQRVYFIYLQSEGGQPFYVKMADKVHSSTATGYLILSSLPDSSYTLRVGFARSTSPESVFNVSLNGKDKGYLLKNMDGTLNLFDLQSLNLQKPANQPSGGGTSYRIKDDPFTRLLSKASSDSTLLMVMIEPPKAEEKKPDTRTAEAKPEVKTEEVKQEAKQETTAVTNAATSGITTSSETLKAETSVQPPPRTDSIAQPLKTEPAVQEPVKEPVKTDSVSQQPKSNIVVLQPEKAADRPIQPDTAQVREAKPEVESRKSEAESRKSEAENQKSEAESQKPPVIQEQQPKQTEAAPAEYKRSVVTRRSESSTTEGFGLVFLDQQDGVTDTIRILIPNPKIPFKSEAATPVQTKEDKSFLNVSSEDTSAKSQPAETAKAPARSSCSRQASENDFLKLRRNMVAENTEDDMVAVARKAFKNRCYTTEQVKNLSALFLTSSGKYQLFDAAYAHVSDVEQFSSLQSELKDEYFLKRFKALIGQ